MLHDVHACTRSATPRPRSEEHTSELQSQSNLVCRLLLEKKKKIHCMFCPLLSFRFTNCMGCDLDSAVVAEVTPVLDQATTLQFVSCHFACSRYESALTDD